MRRARRGRAKRRRRIIRRRKPRRRKPRRRAKKALKKALPSKEEQKKTAEVLEENIFGILNKLPKGKLTETNALQTVKKLKGVDAKTKRIIIKIRLTTLSMFLKNSLLTISP